MNRPRHEIEWDAMDWILEIIGTILLALLIGYNVFYFNDLPESIPTHFNTKGEADGFGAKGTLWMLPVIGLVMYIGLTIMNKFPHIFNYPNKISAENALTQYTGATKLIRVLKLVIAGSFFYISYGSINTALGHQSGLGTYFMPVFLVGTLAPIVVYIIYAYKKK